MSPEAESIAANEVNTDTTAAGEPSPTPSLESLVAIPLQRRHRTRQMPTLSALVGECTDDRHPTLEGRARVRVRAEDDSVHELWLPVLVGVVVRSADHVLLQQPANWSEPVVVGVLDGFEERRERPRSTAHQLELEADEKISVVSRDGQPLLDVWEGETGPVVRLLRADASLEFAGKLALRAETVEIEARTGDIEVKAATDLALKGDTIHLN
jgi:hypothetical protein